MKPGNSSPDRPPSEKPHSGAPPGGKPAQEAWRWKSGEFRGGNAAPAVRLKHLYEPGSWGDLLKCAVLFELVPLLLDAAKSSRVSILDLFAGRPFYPRTSAAAGRCARAEVLPFGKALSACCGPDDFPSAACFAVKLAGKLARPARLDLEVFDLDPEARDDWRRQGMAAVLDLKCGFEALSDRRALEADCILVDPHDLLDRWREVLPRAIELGSSRAVILYLYNKSPRGSGFERNYRGFRQALESAVSRREGGSSGLAWIFRVPADAALPRAFHEVILCGPDRLLEPARHLLARSVEDLNAIIWNQGCFEEIRAGGAG